MNFFIKVQFFFCLIIVEILNDYQLDIFKIPCYLVIDLINLILICY